MANREQYEHGQFAWVDLLARNLDEACEFYTGFFGWEFQPQPTEGRPPYGQFTLAGRAVAGIGEMNRQMLDEQLPARWNSYINVDDIDAIVARAAELGATVDIPVMEVLDAGSLAYITDPAGAAVAFWQKNQHIGAGRTHDMHCVCWHELWTRDVQQARRFYAQLLDWEFSQYAPASTPYWIVECRGEQSSSMTAIDPGWGELPPSWIVYFAVENVDLAADQLRQLGGTVLVPAHDISEGRMATVTDAQGALFNLVESAEESEESQLSA